MTIRSRALRKFLRDRVAVAASGIIGLYVAVALFVAAGGLEILGAHHDQPVVEEEQEVAFYTAPSTESWQRWLGTDRQGRSILVRAVHGVKIAISVGLVAGLLAVTIGTVVGSLAGYFGGRLDDVVVWLYSTVESIPYLLLLLVLSYSTTNLMAQLEDLHGVQLPEAKGLVSIYVAFGATFWVGPCRVVRGEVIRLRESEFVTAARALGATWPRIVGQHVIPNVAHLSFVYFSLVFIGAIKAEVILSFLGLGVQNQPSWGLMIDQARSDMAIDFFWQIGAATAAMFGLVLAFNVFTDALQDALDPKTN